jgi:hypothetical protein
MPALSPALRKKERRKIGNFHLIGESGNGSLGPMGKLSSLFRGCKICGMPWFSMSIVVDSFSTHRLQEQNYIHTNM